MFLVNAREESGGYDRASGGQPHRRISVGVGYDVSLATLATILFRWRVVEMRLY